MANEFALELLARQSELTYQLKLAEYQNELAASIPDILPEFENRDFTIIGSIVTMDAGIYFYEGIKYLQVIAAENAAGFSGLPNSLNDKLHNQLQRLNLFRNIMWLVKEKIKSGVVTAD